MISPRFIGMDLPTWVCDTPNVAASSVRSGNDRYWVRWKRRSKCCIWSDEYIVRGLLIFLPLLLTRVISPFSMDSLNSGGISRSVQWKKSLTKVSFFLQCSKMQLIPLKNFNIKTCFIQFLWFFRLKCWFKGQIVSRIHLSLPNAYKLMCFDRNINGNRDVKFLECD